MLIIMFKETTKWKQKRNVKWKISIKDIKNGKYFD